MGFVDIFTAGEAETGTRQLGIARAEVTEILDSLMSGRVRVKIPSLPDIEPWAPVCTLFAGQGYGLWCMPQVGDTVIVAFEHGDPTWPVVIGSIWNQAGDPPIDQPLDAQYKRVLKTPGGHELVFDDLLKEIRISHLSGHKLTMAAKKVTIELAGGVGKLSLELPGQVVVEGAVSTEVKGKKASVSGDVSLDITSATTTVKADATLRISGGLVTIN
jgi:uncharacterized protein involved in type VI secretion and phage assembly